MLVTLQWQATLDVQLGAVDNRKNGSEPHDILTYCEVFEEIGLLWELLVQVRCGLGCNSSKEKDHLLEVAEIPT